MSKPMMRIHNLQSDEITDREMNAQELLQYEKDKADAEAKKEAEADKAAAREALLQRLGISQEEAQLLLN